jgi:hypothetical protein
VSIDVLVRQGKALPWRASAVIFLGGVPYVRAARHAFPEARALADTILAENGGAGIGHQNRLAAAKPRSPPPSDPHA